MVGARYIVINSALKSYRRKGICRGIKVHSQSLLNDLYLIEFPGGRQRWLIRDSLAMVLP